MIFSFIYFPVELFPVWIPHKFWQLQSYLKGQNDLNLLLHVSLQSVSSLHAWKTGFFVTMALFQVMVLEYIVMGLLAGFAFLRNFKIFFFKAAAPPRVYWSCCLPFVITKHSHASYFLGHAVVSLWLYSSLPNCDSEFHFIVCPFLVLISSSCQYLKKYLLKCSFSF